MGNLALKTVGHYGELGVNRVGGTYRLIGRDVVLVHRMVKNSIHQLQYFLFTETLLNQSKWDSTQLPRIVQHEENYPVFAKISFRYLHPDALDKSVA